MHFGSFRAKAVWRPLTNLPAASELIGTPQTATLPKCHHPVADPERRTLPVGSYPRRGARSRWHRNATTPLPDALVAEFHAMDEKGSDVNLAGRLLSNARKRCFDAAAVMSNDTDLVTPIRMVTAERCKPVLTVCPSRWQVAPKLHQTASHGRHIRAAQSKAAQFPGTLAGSGVASPA